VASQQKALQEREAECRALRGELARNEARCWQQHPEHEVDPPPTARRHAVAYSSAMNALAEAMAEPTAEGNDAGASPEQAFLGGVPARVLQGLTRRLFQQSDLPSQEDAGELSPVSGTGAALGSGSVPYFMSGSPSETTPLRTVSQMRAALGSRTATPRMSTSPRQQGPRMQGLPCQVPAVAIGSGRGPASSPRSPDGSNRFYSAPNLPGPLWQTDVPRTSAVTQRAYPANMTAPRGPLRQAPFPTVTHKGAGTPRCPTGPSPRLRPCPWVRSGTSQ